MGIFSTIMEKLRRGPLGERGAGSAGQQQASGQQQQYQPSTPAQQGHAAERGSTPQGASPVVDMEAVMAEYAKKKGGGGNWRESIVDLLKMLDMDSSLEARKQLAQELGVNAGAHGSAEQNVALHKALMRKIAENGGKVPGSLKD